VLARNVIVIDVVRESELSRACTKGGENFIDYEEQITLEFAQVGDGCEALKWENL
jgi:hypothetical protein